MDFSQFIAVLGSDSVAVGAQLAGLNCEAMVNPNWFMGQGSSVSFGTARLQPETDAVIFFVADQPKISRDLIYRLIGMANDRIEEIIIPVCAGKRRNPVLFKKSTFPDLKMLSANSGGKSIFPDHSIFELDYPNEDEFIDIDTVKDYHDMIGRDEG